MGYKIPSNSHPMIGGQGEMCEINWNSQSLRISNDWDFQLFSNSSSVRRIQGFVWIGVMTSQDGEAVRAAGCWAGEFGLWVFFAFSAVGCSVRMSPIWKKGPVSGCGKVESCWDWIVWMMLNTLLWVPCVDLHETINRCLSILTTRRFGTHPRHTLGHLLRDHHLGGDLEGAKFLDLLMRNMWKCIRYTV